jgi:hypothetical protein
MLALVDLSTDGRVLVECERCGRKYDRYEVRDDPLDFGLFEVEKRHPLPLGYVRNSDNVDHGRGIYGKPTGRHRLREVDGRSGRAYAFECGCGHRRTIGLNALRRKLENATEGRIWL